MEKRLLVAVALCVGILVGWTWVSATWFPPPPRPAPAARNGTAPTPPAVPPGGRPPESAPSSPEPPQAPPVELPLSAARLDAVVSSRGGGTLTKLDVWACSHHAPRDRSVQGDPGQVTVTVEGRPAFLALLVGGREDAALADWRLEAVPGGVRATLEQDGLRIVKTLVVSDDPLHPYHFRLSIRVENAGATPGVAQLLGLVGPSIPYLHDPAREASPEDGVIAAAGDEIPEQFQPAALAETLREQPNHELRSATGWRYVGARHDFHVAAITGAGGEPLPREATVGFLAASVTVPPELGGHAFTAAPVIRLPFETPGAGEARTWEFLVYAGPNSRDVLAEEGGPYEPLADAFPNRGFLFLRFGWMSRFMGWLLGILAQSLGLGWGMAVCALTVLVRGALFPLAKKTQISMRLHAKKMGALKPKLDAIKEKYADNPKKQQEMTMRAFREEKVSFLPGGCLLAFLQMPVWISLYGTLQTTYEMRHAPFLWFPDLTAPDHLFEIPALRDVWGIGGLTQGWVNLLPLLMMVTWYLSAAMQPLPEDPEQRAQAKMMRWIPLVFGVFLYRTAAGLTLYMTLSAVWSIGETWLIRKFWLSKLDPPPGAAPAVAKAR